MIVRFYRQTLWRQSFISHVMRYELNLELDKTVEISRTKNKFYCLSKVH